MSDQARQLDVKKLRDTHRIYLALLIGSILLLIGYTMISFITGYGVWQLIFTAFLALLVYSRADALRRIRSLLREHE